jgi:hypothetical protein
MAKFKYICTRIHMPRNCLLVHMDSKFVIFCKKFCALSLYHNFCNEVDIDTQWVCIISKFLKTSKRVFKRVFTFP